MTATANINKGMRHFAELVVLLGTTTKTNEKLDALTHYFSTAEDADKVWVIALFSGRKPKRTVNARQLAEWSMEITALPAWLFEESYHTVGDLAETIALLLPEAGDMRQQDVLAAASTAPIAAPPPNFEAAPDPSPNTEAVSGARPYTEAARGDGSLSWYLAALIAIGKKEEMDKKAFIQWCWNRMNKDERFVFNKLITGEFRIGVSQKMIVNALAKTVGVDAAVIAHRISGDWDPASISFSALLSEEGSGSLSRPYPFYLAYALEDELAALGEPALWQAEWKWDGIRGELIKRGGDLFAWSRGEELMTDKFPEYQELKDRLPEGTVLDGEIIGFGPAAQETSASLPPSGSPTPMGEPSILTFSALQTRIGRKNVTKKHLKEVPVGFIAYDLLEYNGEDWRSRPLEERRRQLEIVVAAANHPLLRLSPVIQFETWEQLTEARKLSRDRGSEGVMLKRKNSPYQVGRKRGDWWKWKIDPLVIDAVLVYAQKGHGRRSNLYTDYTFAVRDGQQLVTFAKAYSGLTDKELSEVDSFVRKNSIEKFGPVRTVKPELVFEIAFEGIAASARHKSGVALRFPRMNRWRKDKKVDEIDTLDDLKKLLELYGK